MSDLTQSQGVPQSDGTAHWRIQPDLGNTDQVWGAVLCKNLFVAVY